MMPLGAKAGLARSMKSPGPTVSPTSQDIAWAAGIWEGEGTVKHRGKCTEPWWGISAAVTQKERWILDKLREFFGGYITQRYGGKWFEWRIGGFRACGFLQTIYVYLSPRRKAQIKREARINA